MEVNISRHIATTAANVLKLLAGVALALVVARAHLVVHSCTRATEAAVHAVVLPPAAGGEHSGTHAVQDFRGISTPTLSVSSVTSKVIKVKHAQRPIGATYVSRGAILQLHAPRKKTLGLQEVSQEVMAVAIRSPTTLQEALQMQQEHKIMKWMLRHPMC